MGSNLVLLESLVEGEMEALIDEAQDWLATWFSDMRKWSPSEVDSERLTWVRCYGMPVHAWNKSFFKCVVFGTGEFVALDEDTEKRKALDENNPVGSPGLIPSPSFASFLPIAFEGLDIDNQAQINHGVCASVSNESLPCQFSTLPSESPVDNHSQSPSPIQSSMATLPTSVVLNPSPLVVELPPLPRFPPIHPSAQPIPLDTLPFVSSLSTDDGESGGNFDSNLSVEGNSVSWASRELSKEEKIWIFGKKIGVLWQ